MIPPGASVDFLRAVCFRAGQGGAEEEEEKEDLGEEVREQSIQTLRLAADSSRRLPAFKDAAAAAPWVAEAGARRPSKPRSAYSDALQAFCRAVSAAS